MAKQFRSIEEYLYESKYDAIFNALNRFVYNNSKSLTFSKYEDYEYSSARLDDFKITRVYYEKDKSDIINFTVQVCCDIVLKLGKKYDYEEDIQYQYFTIKAFGSLLDKLRHFRITDVDEYTKNHFDKEKSLSKGLLPYIYNEDLDDYATKFLKDVYPEALDNPTKIPTDLIVKKLGLKQLYGSMDDKTFGKMYFSSGEEIVYDKNGVASKIQVKEGTLLINKNAFFMGNIGSTNNTIIHECLHWYLHRDFFNLQKIINPNGNHIECELDTQYNDNCDFSDELKWMEWQASSIAPKVLIPKEMGILKFKECLKQVDIDSDDSIFSKNVRFDTAVNIFAEFFGVSKIAAKIRLIELGFTNAIGVYNFCDGKVLDSFYFKEGFLKPNQTFIVDSLNAAFESTFNQELRAKILNEEVVYVNHCYVLNSDKYIGTYQNGKQYLKQYALEHMDECCLVFDNELKINKTKPSYFNLCYLCRTIDVTNSIEKKYSSKNKAELDKESLEVLKKKHHDEEEFFKTLPSHPGLTIKAHLKRKDMTHDQLSARSKISKRMCDYYMSEYDCTTPDIFDVVALCIGMNLSANYSRDLLNKFGFNIDSKHDLNYDSLRFIIENCHQYTIDSCNEILENLGCKKKIPSNKQSEKGKK